MLDARAVIREVDEEGELIKIYLVADNMSLRNFDPRFESDPYRLETEIMAMLGEKIFLEDGNFIENTLVITSDIVSQFGFVQGMQDSLRDLLNLDLLSLRTQIVPNLLMDRFMSDSSDSGQSNLSKYLDNTTMMFGKYLGRDFFVQALIQMDYYGNQYEEDNPVSVFNIDTEVTLEWKSPLALIQFNLYPNLFGDSGDYLDTSLGLSWAFSY